MTLIHEDEREVVSAVAAVWHADTDDATATPNAVALRALVERLGVQLQQRLAAGARATPAELVETCTPPRHKGHHEEVNVILLSDIYGLDLVF